MANYGPPLLSFETLGNLGKSFTDAYDRSRQTALEDEKRATMKEIGQGLAAGTLDYNQAAGRIASLGNLGGVVELLKLGEAAKQRQLGVDASRALGDALVDGGSLGKVGFSAGYSAPSGGQDSALPTALKMSESGGNWTAQNDEVGAGGQRGHFGRAQFGQARLQEAAAAGAIPQGTTPQQFIRSPELQKAAENWHFNDIDQYIISNGLNRAIGSSIAGIPVTAEGMRNVAHLGGKEGLAKFIASGGRYNPSDSNGTSLMDYLRLGARGSRTAQADLPAAGGGYAEAATGERGFFIPPGGQDASMAPVDPMGNVTGPTPQAMSPQTFDRIAAATEATPMPPVFQSEGVSQPWMGTAIPNQPEARVASQAAPQRIMPGEVLPPARPFDLNADRFAAGGAPAIAQMPQQRLPAPVEIDPNSNDGGSRAFAASQGRNAPVAESDGFVVPPAPQSDAAAFTRASGGSAAQSLPNSNQPAEYTGSGTTAPAALPSAAPLLTKDMPRPTTREQATEWAETKRMEGNQRSVSKLAAALANPNLPANARAVGEIFLKDALEQSKAPDSVKEFMYAKAMGWTTAKSPAEYAKEKTKVSPAEETEGRKSAAASAGLKPGDAGYQGYILTGKMPREDSGPLSATDKKAILEADEMVLTNRTAIDNLRQAKALSGRAYEGAFAGARGSIAGNLGSDAGKATIEYDNLVTTTALGQLKAIFGGNPTEGERKIMLDVQGSASMPRDVREKVLDRAIAAAERRMAFNEQRANELRGGDYYKSPEKRSQPRQQETGRASQDTAPRRISSPDELRGLPSGTLFIDPNGNTRRVP